MTTFGPNQPGAVRCSDCRFSPGRHGATCPTTSYLIYKLGAWRKCKAFAPKDKPCLAEAPKPSAPLFTMPEYQFEGKTFDTFCDDAWIVNDSGAEPVWSFHDEELAVELFRRWMRRRRAEFEHQCDITRRRAAIRTVKP